MGAGDGRIALDPITSPVSVPTPRSCPTFLGVSYDVLWTDKSVRGIWILESSSFMCRERGEAGVKCECKSSGSERRVSESVKCITETNRPHPSDRGSRNCLEVFILVECKGQYLMTST